MLAFFRLVFLMMCRCICCVFCVFKLRLFVAKFLMRDDILNAFGWTKIYFAVDILKNLKQFWRLILKNFGNNVLRKNVEQVLTKKFLQTNLLSTCVFIYQYVGVFALLNSVTILKNI